jgi:hypothetical protein
MKTREIAADFDTHELVGHLLIALLSLKTPVENAQRHFGPIFPQPASAAGARWAQIDA